MPNAITKNQKQQLTQIKSKKSILNQLFSPDIIAPLILAGKFRYGWWIFFPIYYLQDLRKSTFKTPYVGVNGIRPH